MSNKRPGEVEMAHSKRSNVVMREKQNDRMSVFASYANCTEQPMDLTKKPTGTTKVSNSNGDLSHSRHDAPPVVSIDSEEEASDDIGREKLIRKLQDELRNEESKLIFLKQLRYNQRQHLGDHHTPQQHTNHQASHPSQAHAHNHNNAHGNAAHSQVVSGRPAQATNGTAKAHSGPVNTVQAHGGAAHAHGRPGPNNSTPQQQQPNIAAQQAKKAPPNAVQNAPPNRNSGQFQQQQSQAATAPNNQTPRQNQSINNTPTVPAATPQPTPPAPPKPLVLDEAQKQAARGALRRQLEKTLLAIPPPKPLPPELSFIPSLISNDFVKLLGLEEVVKMLLDIQRQEKRDVKYVFNPFRCSQCKSDFTPVWKREKPGSKNVICEQCVTSNQKRSLRQEHTARLKGAFLKAAEQQQELEEQLKKGHIPPTLAAMMPTALQPHVQNTPTIQGSGSSMRQQAHQQERTPNSASIQQREREREARESSHNANSAHSAQQSAAAAISALAAAQQPSAASVNAAAAQLASQLLPQQLAAAAGMSSPQSLLGMAYIQQQLAALASQPAGFGLGSAAVAAAAATLTPAQRQMLLDQLSQQAKSFSWKG